VTDPHQPPASAGDQRGAPPPQVRTAATLLIANLVLSVLVTVLSIIEKNQIVEVTLRSAGHSGMTEAAARLAITVSIWSRAAANVVVGVLYVFLISRLYRGRRWAWRRLVWLSIAGSVGMIYLLTTPYPAIFKVEQVIQLAVLISIAVCVLHPRTRAHYAKPV
jgi:hypothetical protein